MAKSSLPALSSPHSALTATEKQEASKQRSRDRWVPVVQEANDLRDVAQLIVDINGANGARSISLESCVLQARLFLERYTADEIFANAKALVYDSEIRECIRYNGCVGIHELCGAMPPPMIESDELSETDKKWLEITHGEDRR